MSPSLSLPQGEVLPSDACGDPSGKQELGGGGGGKIKLGLE